MNKVAALLDSLTGRSGLFDRLARDTAGNTLMLIAAALLPIMGMVGGSVDMGRAYLAQSRLQQACDAGVLAARKRLGSVDNLDDNPLISAEESGQRFFAANYRDGAFGSRDRTFVMELGSDLAISGTAAVTLPTAVMHIFGFRQVPIEVSCVAQMNADNTDIMMVLDVTGSMALTNPNDTDSRMDSMKSTIRSFYNQISNASAAETRLRFGFVPYSTNVNVGALLDDAWVVSNWKYQSRQDDFSKKPSTRTYNRNWQYVSGNKTEITSNGSYPATLHSDKGAIVVIDANEQIVLGKKDYYSCDIPPPAGDYTSKNVLNGTQQLPFAGPPTGTQTVESRTLTENGTRYSVILDGSTCVQRQQTFTNYTQNFEHVTEPSLQTVKTYKYDQFRRDVSDWRTETAGCMEERGTYEILDYDNVDLSRALDLDIDLVPTSDDATKWRPFYQSIIYGRSKKYDDTGSFTTKSQKTDEEFINPSTLGMASCPAPVRKLAVMTGDDLNAYLDQITPSGQTYHDIGMIWGGRLISPTGLFAAENADVSATRPTSRHLIFLTDGETAPYDIAYSSYGLEPLDQRRWSPSSTFTLKETVENRFAFACNEVKKKNVTVWVVAFGTSLNPIFQQCAGDGRYFEAEDAQSLNEAFATIAASLAQLRVTR